jgi:CysZ protein
MVFLVFGFHIFFGSADSSLTSSDHQNDIGKNHRGFSAQLPAGGCQKGQIEKNHKKADAGSENMIWYGVVAGILGWAFHQGERNQTMSFLKGINYNLRGLGLAFKTPKLLVLGLLRFAVVIIVTIVSASLILVYHQEILTLIWSQPESHWILWLWYLLSWLLSLVLVGVAVILSYLAAQILFAVFVMDLMSRITEKMMTGAIHETGTIPGWQQFFFLIKQEIPRATVPVLLTLLITVIGWLTPFGPIVTILATAVAVIFIAWDNTDLVPARRREPFRQRFRMLLRTLSFHLGFGILFLIPLLNILFLSFAPVGATLYYLDHHYRYENQTC